MTIRFCGACGTEVDETAAFCPSCGRPLGDEAEPASPPAPTWDQPSESEGRGRDAQDQQTAAWTMPSAAEEEREREARMARSEGGESAHGGRERAGEAAASARGSEERPSGDARREEPPVEEPEPGREAERTRAPYEPAGTGSSPSTQRGDAPPDESRPASSGIDLPVSWPVTLSGWLIGVGAVVGVLAMFLPWTIGPGALGFLDRWGLTSPINLLLLVALLGIAASVFFSTIVPDFAHRRLAILVVVLVGLGVALDRLGIGATGFGAVLFFLGMLSATIGALMLEVGADRPLGRTG